MQLDADEDGEPFFRPPVIAPAPNPLKPRENQQPNQQQHGIDQEPGMEEPGGEEARDQAAIAATVTAEQED